MTTTREQELAAIEVDEHWQRMATEIANEVQLSRMAGPCQQPTTMANHVGAIEDVPTHLLPLPHPDPIIAVA